MKRSTRFISYFLAMVMILSLFTTVASAEEGEISNEKETQQSDNTTTTQPIEVELFNDYESFDVQKAPDIITAAEIAQNGYIGRVKSHEKNLYTLVFRNSDGTNTKKIYSHPVKYVDDTGVVRDISLEIGQNKDGSYSTASHEIITTFEKNPLNGITLDYKDVSIKMVPALTGNKVLAAVRSSDNKKITYSLDSSTSYVYELTYTGYKEDIVVKKYTGQTEYMFKLYTNGLTLTKINESYCLVDSEGEVKATIGDVIIFTADERNNTFGSMTYQTVRQNQEYNITIHVDADYLRDPRTVYPIRIDPTIEIRYSNNGAGAIEDVTLNSNAGSDGSSTSLLIGKRNTYGISRVLLKVPALSFDEIPYAVSITSATIGIRDIMCQSSSLDIYCHQFTGGEWTESTANWSNVNPNSYGTCLDSHTVSYANGVAQPSDHSYLFDITSLARQWYSNPSAQNMGVIFKASDAVEGASAHNHKTFGSYSSSYRPVFTLVYESVTPIVLFPSDLDLREGESYTLLTGSNLSGATISWLSADSSVASCGTTNGTSATVTAGKAGTTTITATAQTSDGFAYTATCKVNVYFPDGVYYIKNLNSNQYIRPLKGSIKNGSQVIQGTRVDPETAIEMHKLHQTWKIKHLGSGRYSIRPLYKLNMGLDVTKGNLDIYNIDTTDTLDGVHYSSQWTIEWNSTGYVLKNNGESSKTLKVQDASTSAGAIIIVGNYSDNLNCKWEFDQLANPPTGVMLYDTKSDSRVANPKRYVAPDENCYIGSLNLVPIYYSPSYINQTFTWSSSNTSIATVNSNGMVTGKSPGIVTITATSTQNTSLTVSYTLEVTGIANGTYFLRNKQTLYYADIQGPTMANGTTIHQWQFNGNDSQKWIFDHQGDGFYTIKSANSSTAYYLGVIDNAVVVNSDIVLRGGEIESGMLWRVTVTDNGAFQLTGKNGITNNYALATTTSAQTNGAKLIHGAYVDNDSYRDEWYIEESLFFIDLMEDGAIEEDSIKHTDDGLYIMTTSLADIFLHYDIPHIPANSAGTSSWDVTKYYDDWYLFMVRDSATSTNSYSLYRMREQESDKYDEDQIVADGDDPGVIISFVSLDMNFFEICLFNRETSDLYNLHERFEEIMESGYVAYDDVITTYFNTVESKGSYLIAETYVDMIAQTAVGGVIELPEAYDTSNFRLDSELITINLFASDEGGTLYDIADGSIRINDSNNLSKWEKRAILITHTANTCFNSFAAEVQFHAEKTIEYYGKPLMSGKYDQALRAGMGIGESDSSGGELMPYYSSESAYWRAQAICHGAK